MISLTHNEIKEVIQCEYGLKRSVKTLNYPPIKWRRWLGFLKVIMLL
nr:MAG TPA: hypothetical protein [Caudoviricetes sp.]